MDTRKLTVLIVVPSLRRAGAETQSIDLANGLANKAHSIHLAIYESNKDQLPKVAKNVNVHILRRKSKFSLGYVFALSRLIDKHHVDVVHGVMQFASVVGWLAARMSKSRPPVVAAIHTTVNVGAKEEFIDRLIFAPFLARMTSVVFVCRSQRDHWVRKYPGLASKSIVVYNGIDTDRFQSQPGGGTPAAFRHESGIPADSLVFSCIAGFRAEKGHDLLVRAFSSVPGDAHLLLAGDGPTRARIQQQILDLGLGDRVHLLGNVADVRPLIAASDVTVLASTAVETFSIAMLESLAMSVPVIAPDIGGLGEAIFDGRSGFLFDVGDERGLAGAMQAFVDNPNLAQSMGADARSLVVENFALDKMLTESQNALLAAVDSA